MYTCPLHCLSRLWRFLSPPFHYPTWQKALCQISTAMYTRGEGEAANIRHTETKTEGERRKSQDTHSQHTGSFPLPHIQL